MKFDAESREDTEGGVYILKGCTEGSAQTVRAGWGPALWSCKAGCLHGSHSPDLEEE